MKFRTRHPIFYLPLAILALWLNACSSYPTSAHRNPATTAKANQLIEIAQGLVGTPYKYGGRSPGTGFDCSGFVYYTHHRIGFELPRTSQAQYRASTPIARTQLSPGDLVFFRISRNKISHVGIYLGDDEFVHAPSSGKKVRINSLDEPYWDKHFIRGGRVF